MSRVFDSAQQKLRSVFTSRTSVSPLHSPTLPSKRALARKVAVRSAAFTAVAAIAALGTQAINQPPSTKSSANKAAEIRLEKPATAAGSVTADDGSAKASVSQSPDPITSNSSSTSISTTTDSNGTVNVTVNGQPVDVPAQGNTQQTVTTPDQTSTVTVTNNNSGSTNGFSSNMTSVHNNSFSNNLSQQSQVTRTYGSP